MRLSLPTIFVHLSVLAATAFGSAVYYDKNEVIKRDNTKYVFAHFILGIVASYKQSDWENDMNIAKGIGIDGFALNIGKDSYNDQQLRFAYAAAQAVGDFRVFISFDFGYWNNGDVGTMSTYMRTYGNLPAQFKFNGGAFVSSFIGDGFPYRQVESQSGVKLFACPNWQPNSLKGNANADCGFSWLAWPSQNNRPINANLTTAGDNQYVSALAGKPYMMPVSPWFNTHYGTNTQFNKNWIFLSDTLWGTRWEQVMQINPQFLEIVTWNDFSESHYVGPLHDDNTSLYAGGSNGAVKWVKGMTHDAWRDVAQVYISAFKNGGAPTISTEKLVYYYRPTPKDTTCSDSVPKPDGYQFDQDSVFVIAMVNQPGTVVITSGSNGPVSIDVQPGITTVSAPMGVGTQTFALSRNGNNVFSGNGGLDISNQGCTVYNFNAFVGKIPS